jgi:hypothetical protein
MIKTIVEEVTNPQSTQRLIARIDILGIEQAGYSPNSSRRALRSTDSPFRISSLALLALAECNVEGA